MYSYDVTIQFVTLYGSFIKYSTFSVVLSEFEALSTYGSTIYKSIWNLFHLTWIVSSVTETELCTRLYWLYELLVLYTVVFVPSASTRIWEEYILVYEY